MATTQKLLYMLHSHNFLVIKHYSQSAFHSRTYEIHSHMWALTRPSLQEWRDKLPSQALNLGPVTGSPVYQEPSMFFIQFFFTCVTKNLCLSITRCLCPIWTCIGKYIPPSWLLPWLRGVFGWPLKGFWRHKIKVACQWDVDWIVNEHCQHIRKNGETNIFPG